MEVPEVPEKFNWRKVKQFLKDIRSAILTYRGLEGKNMHLDEKVGEGTVYNAGIGDDGSGGDSGFGTIRVTVEDASGYEPGSGVPLVNGVMILTFDQDNFEIYDGGGGQCVVKLKTCPATCS